MPKSVHFYGKADGPAEDGLAVSLLEESDGAYRICIQNCPTQRTGWLGASQALYRRSRATLKSFTKWTKGNTKWVSVLVCV